MPLPPAMPEASPEPEPEPEAELDPDPLGPGTGVAEARKGRAARMKAALNCMAGSGLGGDEDELGGFVATTEGQLDLLKPRAL